jgi:RNA polymerase sigma factor (sigma-70 family)
MQDLDDISLLREYVERDSEDAFATLVARHVDKVYSIALRHVRNPHQAEEITQAVFVTLAKQARHFSDRVILSGWLCRTAQLTAVTRIRSETRRVRREQEAYMQNLSSETEADVWPQIAPLLDSAMAGLNEADYHALVLRFFDGKSMKEIGAALGASEDAAKMRVNRAVEKLRLFFSRRGIVVSIAGLTAAMSASAVQSAPATVAKTATTVALAQGAAASAQALTLSAAVLKFMAWTKIKTAMAVAIVAVLVAGTATVVVTKISHARPASTDTLTVQLPNNPQDTNTKSDPVRHSVGPERPISTPDPNARFANLTPEQRVKQARRHYPQSLDDLRKEGLVPSHHE